MAVFKILRGESSNIDFGTTPFCDGCVYFAKDTGGLYIDAIVDGQNKRIYINNPVSDEIASYIDNVIKKSIGDAMTGSY